MAWNPSPQVAVARDFAQKFGMTQVIILSIDEHSNLSYAAYGKTRVLCDSAEKVADIAFNAIMKGENNAKTKDHQTESGR